MRSRRKKKAAPKAGRAWRVVMPSEHHNRSSESKAGVVSERYA